MEEEMFAAAAIADESIADQFLSAMRPQEPHAHRFGNWIYQVTSAAMVADNETLAADGRSRYSQKQLERLHKMHKASLHHLPEEHLPEFQAMLNSRLDGTYNADLKSLRRESIRQRAADSPTA